MACFTESLPLPNEKMGTRAGKGEVPQGKEILYLLQFGMALRGWWEMEPVGFSSGHMAPGSFKS